VGKFNFRADNAGREPQLGDYVAYNYSGQIAAGFIRRIGKGKWHPIFEIEMVLPEEGHKSLVKGGPKCVLVLDRDDDVQTT
jgi:hypothetical protein